MIKVVQYAYGFLKTLFVDGVAYWKLLWTMGACIKRQWHGWSKNTALEISGYLPITQRQMGRLNNPIGTLDRCFGRPLAETR